MTHEIQNAESLTSIYGSWPAFHDAEVLSVVLGHQPTTGGPASVASLEIALADRETRTPSLVTLRFSGLRDVELEGFDKQNILFELEITQATGDDGFKTVCRSSVGLSGAWISDAIEVVSVTRLG